MINGSWEHVPPLSMGGAQEYTDADNIASDILQEYGYASMTLVSNRPALTLSHELSTKWRRRAKRSSDQLTRWLIRPHDKETGASTWREHYHVFTWPYTIHFILRNVVRTRVRVSLRMCKQNTKATVPLDVVPERRTERFPPSFRAVGRFCELRFR